MDYILIRKNNIYYIKHLPTSRLYNTTSVEDLRQIRDLINEANDKNLKEYRERENIIRELLGCTRLNEEEL